MAREFKFKKIPLAPKSAEMLDYREQILMALRQPAPVVDPRTGATQPGSVTYEEAAKRLPLIKKVMDCKGDTIVLEDAEWEEMCRAFKRLQYTAVLEGVVELGEDLLNAPIVELTPVKGAGDAPDETATV